VLSQQRCVVALWNSRKIDIPPHACLTHVPECLSLAEVLGFNEFFTLLRRASLMMQPRLGFVIFFNTDDLSPKVWNMF
jgi:hypothetical protein